MQRILFSLVFLLTALSLVAAAQSQNQSLGDYARAVKKNNPSQGKQTPKVYDNDNLPANSSLSVVGNATSDASSTDNKDQAKDQDKKSDAQAKDESGKDNPAEKAQKKDEPPQIKPGQSAEDRKQAEAAWKSRLDAQKDKVALLARELDVLQKEYQLKASEFYADPQRRVQDPNYLVEQDQKYKSQIEDKQKALDDAKSELSNMEEEAHRQGAPSSVTE